MTCVLVVLVLLLSAVAAVFAAAAELCPLCAAGGAATYLHGRVTGEPEQLARATRLSFADASVYVLREGVCGGELGELDDGADEQMHLLRVHTLRVDGDEPAYLAAVCAGVPLLLNECVDDGRAECAPEADAEAVARALPRASHNAIEGLCGNCPLSVATPGNPNGQGYKQQCNDRRECVLEGSMNIKANILIEDNPLVFGKESVIRVEYSCLPDNCPFQIFLFECVDNEDNDDVVLHALVGAETVTAGDERVVEFHYTPLLALGRSSFCVTTQNRPLFTALDTDLELHLTVSTPMETTVPSGCSVGDRHGSCDAQTFAVVGASSLGGNGTQSSCGTESAAASSGACQQCVLPAQCEATSHADVVGWASALLADGLLESAPSHALNITALPRAVYVGTAFDVEFALADEQACGALEAHVALFDAPEPLDAHRPPAADSTVYRALDVPASALAERRVRVTLPPFASPTELMRRPLGVVLRCSESNAMAHAATVALVPTCDADVVGQCVKAAVVGSPCGGGYVKRDGLCGGDAFVEDMFCCIVGATYVNNDNGSNNDGNESGDNNSNGAGHTTMTLLLLLPLVCLY